ncbi:hypothetical protein HanPI659440_Chr16g0639401 [Helianthus annuus]|uniref:Uncharacterized protein n=1 Tax=Helianthus annuus TaxID=4232 RepID=A0A251S0L2_HELAN|nr:hypothetical protein HanXRQr2_Chr16g0749531 [Helianthus annuus]KAJ0681733.1 hypothetical protein HanPI659440_Chr16g0639401 [Helianthus annuus]
MLESSYAKSKRLIEERPYGVQKERDRRWGLGFRLLPDLLQNYSKRENSVAAPE